MKNKVRNMLIILIITIIVFYILFKDSYKAIGYSLMNANVLYLLLAFLVYSIYFIFDTIPFYNFAKQYNKDISFKYMIYLNTVTKFFNGITPLSTGGQPFQVLELKKKNISPSNGTNIVVQNYIVFQIALVVWGIAAIILNRVFNLFEPDPILKNLCIIGYTLNFIILFLLFLISLSERVNKAVVRRVISLLHKIKIVRNKEKQLEKWNNICEDFYINSKLLMNNKKIFISGVVMQLICLTIYFLLPLILSYSIGCSDSISIVVALSAGAYIFLMGCYIPIPGATGGMEFAFLGFYGNYINGVNLDTLLILWRTLTYYLPTLIGGVVFNINSSRLKRNNK